MLRPDTPWSPTRLREEATARDRASRARNQTQPVMIGDKRIEPRDHTGARASTRAKPGALER